MWGDRFLLKAPEAFALLFSPLFLLPAKMTRRLCFCLFHHSCFCVSWGQIYLCITQSPALCHNDAVWWISFSLCFSYQTGLALTASSNHRMYRQNNPTIRAWTVDTNLERHTHTISKHEDRLMGVYSQGLSFKSGVSADFSSLHTDIITSVLSPVSTSVSAF